MLGRNLFRNRKGYTLIELIAVLVMLSILAAVAVPRFIDLAESAKRRALDFAVSELDGREYLSWAKIKLSIPGWQNDDEVRDQVSYNLGDEYSWSAGPTATGGRLDFKDHPMDLDRTPSTYTAAPDWK
jgi:prepilin-type N-terminal cleavage/methylation domain-containing protein